MHPNEGKDHQEKAPAAVQPPVGGGQASSELPNSQSLSASFDPDETIQWQASEFIDHQKNAGWFLVAAIGTIVVGVILFLITHSILSTGVVVIAGLTFAVFAGQKPRTLTYALLPTTVKVGDKQYSYDDFKTFSVVQDGVLESVVLQPLKRFMPPLTLYFAQEDGEKIFDILAAHIPHEERTLDPIDNLMRKIRF